MPVAAADDGLTVTEEASPQSRVEVRLPRQGHTGFKVRAYEIKGIFSSGFADWGKADRRIENLPCQSGLAALFKISLRQQHGPVWGNRDHELAVILHRRHRCRPSQAVRHRESRAQPPGVLRIQGRLIVLDRVLEICAWGQELKLSVTRAKDRGRIHHSQHLRVEIVPVGGLARRQAVRGRRRGALRRTRRNCCRIGKTDSSDCVSHEVLQGLLRILLAVVALEVGPGVIERAAKP